MESTHKHRYRRPNREGDGVRGVAEERKGQSKCDSQTEVDRTSKTLEHGVSPPNIWRPNSTAFGINRIALVLILLRSFFR